MQVFIAGSTGVLGRRLIQQFTARGDKVVAMVRNEKGERIVSQLGAIARYADLFNVDSLAKAADGSEVVIHAATSIPTKSRTTARDWAMNDRIRREGTKALTACTAKIGARRYIQQSIIWVAMPPDGSFFDENTPVKNPNVTHASAYDSEQITQEAGAAYGFSTAILRCGWFYGADAGHTRFFGQGLKKGRLPVIGDGQALWSVLHLDDAASAFVTASVSDTSGLWHIVDNQPVKVADFMQTFAQLLNAPKPRHIPAWVARLVVGKNSVDFFTDSVNTSNERFLRDFSWTPTYATYVEGLKQIVQQWSEEGFLL